MFLRVRFIVEENAAIRRLRTTGPWSDTWRSSTLGPLMFVAVADRMEERISTWNISKLRTVLVEAFIVVLVVIHLINSSCTNSTSRGVVERGEEGQKKNTHDGQWQDLSSEAPGVRSGSGTWNGSNDASAGPWQKSFGVPFASLSVSSRLPSALRYSEDTWALVFCPLDQSLSYGIHSSRSDALSVFEKSLDDLLFLSFVVIFFRVSRWLCVRSSFSDCFRAFVPISLAQKNVRFKSEPF